MPTRRTATTPRPAAAKRDAGAAARSTAASPWRQRQGAQELKREAVLHAAARAFNHHGFHNTSLDRIAAELQVTKPTLYYYFKSKERLLYGCFLAGLAPILAALTEAGSDSAPARERLHRVIASHVQAMASDFGWCLTRADDLNLSTELREHIRERKSEIDQGLRRLIREGIADGSIARCDPKMTALALAGACNGIAHWYRESRALTPAQIAAEFITLFESGLKPRA